MHRIEASSTSGLRIADRLATKTQICVFVWLMMCGCFANAEGPFVPAADSEVLETLPRSLISGRDEITEMRRQLAKTPKNESLAVEVARRFLQIGNQDGDPRFYGYARSALSPWWIAESPASEILKLRAKLKEKDHLYDEALVDLSTLLRRDDRDAQAWIELANINRVKGEYAEAWKACAALEQFAGIVPTTLCRAPLLAATGKADEGYNALVEILPIARRDFPSVIQWVLTSQAEYAIALSKPQLAEQHFREGLASNSGSTYLLRSFADYLLDHDRPEEAFDLLHEHTNDNGILLRAMIAARQTGQNDLAEAWKIQLNSRFEEIRLRGGEPHGRYESRFQLEVNDNAKLALSIALANWIKQKETRDTRNVLEAAIAANDATAATPVIEFLEKHNTQHVVLQKLVEQLVSKP